MSSSPAPQPDQGRPRFEERGPTASTCFTTTCTDDAHLRDVRHPQRGWVTACPGHGWAVRQLYEQAVQAEPRARVARSGAHDPLSPTQGGRATPTGAERESRDDASETRVAHDRPACHAKGGA